MFARIIRTLLLLNFIAVNVYAESYVVKKGDSLGLIMLKRKCYPLYGKKGCVERVINLNPRLKKLLKKGRKLETLMVINLPNQEIVKKDQKKMLSETLKLNSKTSKKKYSKQEIPEIITNNIKILTGTRVFSSINSTTEGKLNTLSGTNQIQYERIYFYGEESLGFNVGMDYIITSPENPESVTNQKGTMFSLSGKYSKGSGTKTYYGIGFSQKPYFHLTSQTSGILTYVISPDIFVGVNSRLLGMNSDLKATYSMAGRDKYREMNGELKFNLELIKPITKFRGNSIGLLFFIENTNSRFKGFKENSNAFGVGLSVSY